MHRLKELRGDKSQDYVANKIGISRQSFRNYEAGTREPDLNTLKLIADYFEVTVDYLLGRTDSPDLTIPKKIEDMEFAFSGGISLDGLSKEDIDTLKKMADFMRSNKK